jgi:hypothetical protein
LLVGFIIGNVLGGALAIYLGVKTPEEMIEVIYGTVAVIMFIVSWL